MATLPGVWRYMVNTGTGWPRVSILWLGEKESFICNVCLKYNCLSRPVPEILYHVAGMLTNQQTNGNASAAAVPAGVAITLPLLLPPPPLPPKPPLQPPPLLLPPQQSPKLLHYYHYCWLYISSSTGCSRLILQRLLLLLKELGKTATVTTVMLRLWLSLLQLQLQKLFWFYHWY